MSCRRSRFHRMYHRWFRSRPDRRRQWEQIVKLRQVGSAGFQLTSSTASGRRAADPAIATQTMDLINWESNGEPLANAGEVASFRSAPNRQDAVPRGQLAMVIQTIWLFLLACGYAGLAGIMHTRHDTTGWIGLAGAFASLIVAGYGICLTTTPDAGHACRQFLTLLSLFLTGLYLILASVSAGI